MDSLIDGLENNKFAELKDDVEEIILKKIDTKVEEKKDEIINVLNGVENNEDSSNEDSSNEESEDNSEK